MTSILIKVQVLVKNQARVQSIAISAIFLAYNYASCPSDMNLAGTEHFQLA